MAYIIELQLYRPLVMAYITELQLYRPQVMAYITELQLLPSGLSHTSGSLVKS